MKKAILLLVYLSIVLLSSCQRNNNATPEPTPISSTITIKAPLDFPNATFSDLVATITHIETGKVTKTTPEQIKDNLITTSLYEGENKIELTGMIHITDKFGVESEGSISYTGQFMLSGNKPMVDITLMYTKPSSGFVIEELYFSPSLTPEGKPLRGGVEQYIKIRNNSDNILYADGLVLMESEFGTNRKQDYKPNIMATDMAVDAIAMIPGNGHDHPVKPGEYILIANNAENHILVNPNSVNLENADFEWYDVSSVPKMQDVDNPKVPNLDKIHASTKSIQVFKQNGSSAIAIGKMPITKEKFLADYKYDYTYVFVFKGKSYDRKGSAYRFPNEWIIDAVNLGMSQGFEWIVTDPSLDSGYTGWSQKYGDKSAYGFAARRKVLSTNAEGRTYLKDTNNSTEDFDGKVTPSLKAQ